MIHLIPIQFLIMVQVHLIQLLRLKDYIIKLLIGHQIRHLATLFIVTQFLLMLDQVLMFKMVLIMQIKEFVLIQLLFQFLQFPQSEQAIVGLGVLQVKQLIRQLQDTKMLVIQPCLLQRFPQI